MVEYFSTVGRVLLTYPTLSTLAIISLAARLAAMHLGIRAAATASWMARSDFIMFSILYVVVTFVAVGCILMIGTGFETETGFLLLIGLLSPIAYYFLAHATARRLTDIGWSRYWTWLFVIDGVVLPFMLLLCLVPGKASAVRAQA